MPELIQIKEGLVTLIEQRVVKTCPLDTFEEQLATNIGIKTPLLPPGCILYGKKSQRACFVLEQEPKVQVIKYARRDAETESYKIPVPRMYLFASFHEFALESVHVYFARNRLRRMEDPLFHVPLPNISVGGSVCLGSYRFKVTSALSDRVVDVARFFWDSTFNDDITESYRKCMPEQIQALADDEDNYLSGWQHLSLQEAECLDWLEACSVSEAFQVGVS